MKKKEGKKGTVLVTADSILSGLREIKVFKRKFINVRYFPGARIRDMLFYLVPLLQKVWQCNFAHCN